MENPESQARNPKSEIRDSRTSADAHIFNGFRISCFGFLLFLGFLLLFSSCAVPQWKRGHLGDPIMRFDEDPDGEFLDQHFLPYREGSSGGYGSSGGGCGC